MKKFRVEDKVRISSVMHLVKEQAPEVVLLELLNPRMFTFSSFLGLQPSPEVGRRALSWPLRGEGRGP